MLTKEELKDTYLKYSPDITEEIFNKITQKLTQYFGESNRKDILLDYINFKSNYNYITIFSGMGYNWSLDNNTQGNKKIQVSNIIDLEDKFKVGKWYSFYWNWGNGYNIVAKVYSIKDCVYFDNFVNLTHGNTEVDQSSNAIRLDKIENIKELSLEEIQRYLPEGHKDKLPKKLTIDDLVKGEIYYFRNDSGEWILLFGGNIRDCKTVHKQSTRFTTGNFTVRCAELRLATPEEKHWLITSIKQNKFIPQSELDKYDERGNLVETDYLNILNIEVGDIVKCVSDRNVTKFANYNGAGWESDLEFIVTKIDGYSEYKVYFGGKDNNGVFSDAVRLVKRKETKHIDRNWYVEVNSQEEADAILQYLESIGEKVGSTNLDRLFNSESGYIYVTTNSDDITWWVGKKRYIKNKIQKQLSDIIPNYSKVNRNVYYEVENQEQYLEILDWLESKGEFLHPNSRTLEVINNWKYVVFNLSIPNSWALRGGIPDLPKAEFQFKSKPGLREQINPEYIFPIEGLSTYEYPIITEKCCKQIPGIGTEIKFISSEEEPQIEMPKLKVITNKIDLLTLKN